MATDVTHLASDLSSLPTDPQLSAPIRQLLASHRQRIYPCLFNLVVLLPRSPTAAEMCATTAHTIASLFPCRMFFINEETLSSTPSLAIRPSLTVSESSFPQQAEAPVHIAASSDTLSLVPLLLFPLLFPDLPLYLLWGEDPTTDSVILPAMERVATRLIFSLESIEQLHRSSHTLLQRLTIPSRHLVDLNWTRVSGWREVLAEVFDSQEKVEQLLHAQGIEIVYCHAPHLAYEATELQAYYLQAWLASRLNWTYLSTERQAEHTLVMTYRTPLDSTVILSLVPCLDTLTVPREVVAVHVQGADYTVHLDRSTPDQVKVHAFNQHECLLPFTLFMQGLQSGRKFMQELLYQKVSDHYIQLLRFISAIK